MRNSIGGSVIYDIGCITSGKGISSDPWMVLSLQTNDKYTVVAMQINSASYYENVTLEDAEFIFKHLTDTLPKYYVKPEPIIPTMDDYFSGA